MGGEREGECCIYLGSGSRLSEGGGRGHGAGACCNGVVYCSGG
jgi:hypothetical protein